MQNETYTIYILEDCLNILRKGIEDFEEAKAKADRWAKTFGCKTFVWIETTNPARRGWTDWKRA